MDEHIVKEKNYKLQKLSKHTKEDIIEAIGCSWQADFILDELLRYLESCATRKLFEARDKAFNEAISAQEACNLWLRRMCEKYGDGKTVKLSNVPSDEIKRGAALENKREQKNKALEKLNSKINKQLGISKEIKNEDNDDG